MKFAKTLPTFIAVFTMCTACNADNNPVITKAASQSSVELVTLTEDVGIPWAMVQLPNNDIVVANRSGELKLMSYQDNTMRTISGLPKVWAQGQGGLLDLELHPNFADNRWLYFTLAHPAQAGEKGEGSNTALMRAKLSDDGLSLANVELLYKGEDNTTKGQHFGSRIVFDDKGYVYFSIGDRGERSKKPQRLDLDGGKIYRLHQDGSIPSDNPFVNIESAKAATFSYGHRNPQGMVIHPKTGAVWSHEHGPRGGDEVNIIQAGKNYGWPEITFGINYIGTKITEHTAKEGMEQPLHYWDPSIAPSDMVFVTSSKYPQWQGKLLIGSMKFQYLEMLTFDERNSEQVMAQNKLFEGIGRVRSIMQGRDGFLYLGIDGGKIVRLVPNS